MSTYSQGDVVAWDDVPNNAVVSMLHPKTRGLEVAIRRDNHGCRLYCDFGDYGRQQAGNIFTAWTWSHGPSEYPAPPRHATIIATGCDSLLHSDSTAGVAMVHAALALAAHDGATREVGVWLSWNEAPNYVLIVRRYARLAVCAKFTDRATHLIESSGKPSTSPVMGGVVNWSCNLDTHVLVIAHFTERSSLAELRELTAQALASELIHDRIQQGPPSHT